MAKFNYREVARAVATSEIGTKRVNTIMQARFDEAKDELIDEFDHHPVTQEIEEGVGASNGSGTLEGQGDLFSFIGFDEGSDPISPVRNVLEHELALIKSSKGDLTSDSKINYKFSLRVPTESIKKASPIPWEQGLSWVEGIEKGISGFSHFIRGRFPSSHSGGGLEAKNEVRSADFVRVPYLSAMFKNLVSKFK